MRPPHIVYEPLDIEPVTPSLRCDLPSIALHDHHRVSYEGSLLRLLPDDIPTVTSGCQPRTHQFLIAWTHKRWRTVFELPCRDLTVAEDGAIRRSPRREAQDVVAWNLRHLAVEGALEFAFAFGYARHPTSLPTSSADPQRAFQSALC